MARPSAKSRRLSARRASAIARIWLTAEAEGRARPTGRRSRDRRPPRRVRRAEPELRTHRTSAYCWTGCGRAGLEVAPIDRCAGSAGVGIVVSALGRHMVCGSSPTIWGYGKELIDFHLATTSAPILPPDVTSLQHSSSRVGRSAASEDCARYVHRARLRRHLCPLPMREQRSANPKPGRPTTDQARNSRQAARADRRPAGRTRHAPACRQGQPCRSRLLAAPATALRAVSRPLSQQRQRLEIRPARGSSASSHIHALGFAVTNRSQPATCAATNRSRVSRMRSRASA